ncbi:MAG: hypothetical protein K0R12_9 [Gammaproteobacteria bacterium]|nr:hypothetical protein [Gammaproteobacteria bacterium]
MPVLVRDDGSQFITRAYRETLSFKKFALLKREVLMLERDNGHFLRLFVQPNGDMEAVFSHEEGYLLGETVWHFFEKPENLIYCEILGGIEQAILVVVRQGKVFLDAKVPVAHLPDEFSGLFFDETAYDIYLYGQVPIGVEGDTAAEFVLPPEAVHSMVHLDEPVFASLPHVAALSLLPVSQALKLVQGKSFSPVVIILLSVVAIAGVSWFSWTLLKPVPPPPPPPVTNAPPPPPPADPLLYYQQALQSPEPQALFQALAERIHLLYSLSGWTVQSVTAAQGGLQVNLAPGNPAITAAPLEAWAKANNLQVDFKTGSATLYLNVSAENRKPLLHPALSPLLDLASMVQQRLQTVALPEKISMGEPQAKSGYRQVVITVSFADAAPEYLVFLGNIVEGLPVVVDSYSISMSGTVVSGSVALAVLGQ